MIKRQYFIYAEIQINEFHKANTSRQFWFKSWFSSPAKVLDAKRRMLSDEFDVELSVVNVMSFNRI